MYEQQTADNLLSPLGAMYRLPKLNDNTDPHCESPPMTIKIDPAASLVSFTAWLSLLVGAMFAFSLLSGSPFPGFKVLWILVPTAILLSGFSSVVSQISQMRT